MDRPRRASAEGLAAPLALLAVLVGYLPGCAMHYPWHEWWEIIELSQEGSHRQALEIFEREFPDGTSNEAVLFLACEGYYYVRDYAKFQSCSRWMLHVFEPLQRYDLITAGLHLRRARARLDLGDPGGALAGAQGARRLLGDHRELSAWEVAPIQLLDTRLPIARIEMYEVFGLAHAFRGERRQAEQYLDRISRIRQSVFDGNIARARRIARTRIRIALGEYAEARALIESREGEGTSAADAGVMLLIAGGLVASYMGEQDAPPTSWSGGPLLGEARSESEILANALDLALSEALTIQSKAQLLSECFMLATIYLETGDERAKPIFDAILEDPATPHFGGIHLWSLHKRGAIALAEGDREGAIAYLTRAVETIESQRSTLTTDADKIGFVGDKQVVYSDLVGTLIDEGRPKDALAYAERAKARALVDLLAGKGHFGGGASARRGEANRLLAELRAAERRAALLPDREPDAAARTREAGDLRRAISAADPELGSLVQVTPLDVEELLARLRPDEALLEYFGHGDDLFAFVATRGGVEARRLDPRKFDRDAYSFRRSVREVRSRTHLALGKALYERLVAPVESSLAGARQLTIVPHGPLHYLPMGALHTGRQYLIERYAFRLLPSASVLEFIRDPTPGGRRRMLVFGNPELDDERYELPHAEREARRVAEGREAVVLVGDQATEAAFRRDADRFELLHFATHAVFRPEAPLESGLLLTADVNHDGVVTVAELFDLRLDAELVTLSGCETGIGRLHRGDEIVGFTRSLLYAGANSIVASLWEVDDLATAKLMEGFYAREADVGKLRALQAAQLRVKQDHPHPFYWASFQLIGAP